MGRIETKMMHKEIDANLVALQIKCHQQKTCVNLGLCIEPLKR